MDRTANSNDIHNGVHNSEPSAPLSLMDMPQEILEQIVVLCDARSVCMLASLCRLARATMGCDRTWRLLFDRDFRHMYGPDLDALGQVRIDWPRLAVDIVGQQLGHPFDLSVPNPTDDPRVPGPFSRMRAYGKDWRWLYAAHREEPVRTGSRATYMCQGITIYGLCQVSQTCPNTTMYFLGDTVNRCRAGYGVKVVRDHRDRVIAWEEGIWQDHFCAGYALMAGDGQVLCAIDKALFSGTPAFFHNSRSDETTWGVLKSRKWIGRVVRKSAGSDQLRIESGDGTL